MTDHPYFTARWLWNRARRAEALAVVDGLLRPVPGAQDDPAVIDPAALVDHPGLDRFETLLTWLIVTPGVLALPVGQAFARLWTAAPVQPLVTALTLRPFPTAEAEADEVAAIIDVLGRAADAGSLSGRSADYLTGGRAVLTLAAIDDLTLPWDGLREPLRPRLAAAYERAGDPWPAWRTGRPACVLARGLDTLIGQHQPGAEVDSFWRAIRHGHPTFAAALLAVLDDPDTLDGVADPRRFVEVHADLDAVDDAVAWLAGLAQALESDDLTSLVLPRSRPR